MKAVAKADVIERHEAEACRHCLAGLTPAMVRGAEKRQVFDLPEPRLTVTEHQAMIYRCAHCRGQTTAAFPDGVVSPAQYGPRVRAAAVYLNVQQLIPEDRVAQTMADLFGAMRLCPDSVVAWGKKKAEELQVVGRGSANSWLELACAMSTKRAFASPAKAIGCIPPRRSP